MERGESKGELEVERLKKIWVVKVVGLCREKSWGRGVLVEEGLVISIRFFFYVKSYFSYWFEI